jgi:hypothetical protein
LLRFGESVFRDVEGRHELFARLRGGIVDICIKNERTRALTFDIGYIHGVFILLRCVPSANVQNFALGGLLRNFLPRVCCCRLFPIRSIRSPTLARKLRLAPLVLRPAKIGDIALDVIGVQLFSFIY